MEGDARDLLRDGEDDVEVLDRQQVFGLPGVGRYFVQGAINRDYTLVMGMVIFYATLILLLNLAVDLLYGWLDPRIRHA